MKLRWVILLLTVNFGFFSNQIREGYTEWLEESAQFRVELAEGMV